MAASDYVSETLVITLAQKRVSTQGKRTGHYSDQDAARLGGAVDASNATCG